MLDRLDQRLHSTQPDSFEVFRIDDKVFLYILFL